MDGIDLLTKLLENSIPRVFLDPQYQGVFDHLSYGNVGVHNIPTCCDEVVSRRNSMYPKTIGLPGALIQAIANPNDIVADPAAGSFRVLSGRELNSHDFLGCDMYG